MSLKGKTAVITGSNSGIGRAIAEKCLREGAKVAVHGLNQSEVDSAVDELVDFTVDTRRELLVLCWGLHRQQCGCGCHDSFGLPRQFKCGQGRGHLVLGDPVEGFLVGPESIHRGGCGEYGEATDSHKSEQQSSPDARQWGYS